MDDLVSVIIPVYNAETYLERCLQSVCKQTYRQLEIICINDGSMDNSADMLDKWATEDGRIKVVHQENHGESQARNVGVSLATGSWIAFVDNDDWIDLDMYRAMIEFGCRYEADMVCCSWVKEQADESIRARNTSEVADNPFDRDKLLKYIYIRDEYQGFAYMWDKLYRRELFEGVYFDESLRIGGDVLVLAEIALKVKRATYIDEAYYHYLQREDSGCHTDRADVLLDWVRAYHKVIDIFQGASIEPEIMRYVKRFTAYTALRAAKAALLSNDKNSHESAVCVMKQYQLEYKETNGMYPERLNDFKKAMEWRDKV